jgi:hypothetical protein
METTRRRRLEAMGDVEKLDQMFEMNAARAIVVGLVVGVDG